MMLNDIDRIRVGDRVITISNDYELKKLNGLIGTVIEEIIPQDQLSFLTGIAKRFKVKFDSPVEVTGGFLIAEANFRMTDLKCIYRSR